MLMSLAKRLSDTIQRIETNSAGGIVVSTFGSWFDAMRSNSVNIRLASRFMCKKLLYQINLWQFTGLVRGDYGEKVWLINQALKNKKIRTRIGDANESSVPLPDGMYILDRLLQDVEAYKDSSVALNKLFADEQRNPTDFASDKGLKNDKTFLFFNKQNPRSFMDIIRFLYNGYEPLARLVLLHGLAYVDLIGGGMGNLERCSLTFVKYDQRAGLIPHIDNVSDFGNSFGPIFTLAMSPGIKRLDMLPTLCPSCDPVRVYTHQYQSILIQGMARSDYSHAVPFGNKDEHVTIAY